MFRVNLQILSKWLLKVKNGFKESALSFLSMRLDVCGYVTP
jgi:hypothetical protein